MGFIQRLKSWFGKAATPAPEKSRFIRDPESGVLIETDDPDQAAAIAMVLKTGKPVIGTRGPDGKMTIKPLEP